MAVRLIVHFTKMLIKKKTALEQTALMSRGLLNAEGRMF